MIVWPDDPARRLTHIWKGTPDGITWPFDARYGAWAAGVGLSIGMTLAWWPVTRIFHGGGVAGGVLLIVALLTVCGLAAVNLRGKLPGRRWLLPLAFVPALFMMLVSPATSGGAMGALLALGLAAGLGVTGAVIIVRRVGKQIDKVTPLRYQLGVIAAESRAPRPVAPVAHPVPGVVDVTTTDVTAHLVTAPREITT